MTAKSFLTSDGARIAYEDEGAGRPVVLVHGLGNTRAHWAFQRPALLDAGYRVVTIDLRFHGASDATTNGKRISRLGLDLLELIDAEQLTDIAAVGHSMGVSVILAAVSAGGIRSIGKAVLIDQSARIMNDDGWSLGVFGVTWDRLEAQLSGRQAWGDWQREPAAPEHLRALMAAHPFADLFSGPHAALVADHFVADWRDEVPRLVVPTLVATGATSPVYPLEAMEWLAATLPQGSLRVYEHSGHTPHLNTPTEFNHDLLEFLQA